MIFYDFEVFAHNWLMVAINTINRKIYRIETKSDLENFYWEHKHLIWVGYNSRRYDQYILKAILCDFNPKKINDYMIVERQPGWKFSRLLNKFDINNFDVMTSSHSLKQLEGFMGYSIKETTIPFDIDRPLTDEEKNEVYEYCLHDTQQTMNVFMERVEEFDSHMSLIKQFDLPLSYISKTKAQLAAIILGAKRKKRDDEFELIFPDTLIINKYFEVLEFYSEAVDYDSRLEVDIAGVPHIFGWGGLHGAINQYHDEGLFINIDVASYYPSLMIEYDFLSRNVRNPKKYKEIRDRRLELKKQGDPLNEPLKIVLNSTYGCMKDKYNHLYDPRQANNVCVGGQLLLLDLIEKLEDHCKIIQSNTDGVLVKVNNISDIEDICQEWQDRTRMILEFQKFERIHQKDVNNYIFIGDGIVCKGGYVKELSALDYDLPAVNFMVWNYFVNKVLPEESLDTLKQLIYFQKIVRISNNYDHAIYKGEIQQDKCFRVFASRSRSDGGIYKVKTPGANPEKFANTPDNCFINNDDVNGLGIPRKLDQKWYVDLAYKRITDFGGLVHV